MTTDADFRSLIEADPADAHTLLVYADFLQERDDPAAEGWRALGSLRKCPRIASGDKSFVFDNEDWHFSIIDGRQWHVRPNGEEFCLPNDWMKSFVRDGVIYYYENSSNGRRDFVFVPPNIKAFVLFKAAAVAFTRLPLARRCELLKTPIEVGTNG